MDEREWDIEEARSYMADLQRKRLRDEFARAVISGIVAAAPRELVSEVDRGIFARRAYLMADAMLKVRDE